MRLLATIDPLWWIWVNIRTLGSLTLLNVYPICDCLEQSTPIKSFSYQWKHMLACLVTPVCHGAVPLPGPSTQLVKWVGGIWLYLAHTLCAVQPIELMEIPTHRSGLDFVHQKWSWLLARFNIAYSFTKVNVLLLCFLHHTWCYLAQDIYHFTIFPWSLSLSDNCLLFLLALLF